MRRLFRLITSNYRMENTMVEAPCGTEDYELIEQIAVIISSLLPVDYSVAVRRLEAAAGTLKPLDLYTHAPAIAAGKLTTP